MRVVLDLTPLVTPSALRGIGRYVQGLVQGLHALPPEDRGGIELLGLAANRELTQLFIVEDLVEYCARPALPPIDGAGPKRARLITFNAASMIPEGALLHLTDPKGIPLSRRLRYTVTSFDLISLALPELYLPKIPYWSKLHATLDRVRYSRVERVLAISHATRSDLRRFLGIPESKIDVVWLGVDHARFQPIASPGEAAAISQLLASPEPYILYLGAGDARKDLDTLVRAYAHSRAKTEARLVIAGKHDPSRVASLASLIESLGLTGRAVQLGYVDELNIPALYRQARVHAFVSRYEGFGLPVLEALACGTPTITSPGSSLDEVTGDAAVIVPCGAETALAEALDRLFYDEDARAKLCIAGIERARTFTWERCAAEHLEFWAKAPLRSPA
jgi:glycosyltransferase involved in cell wall biosynthesis